MSAPEKHVGFAHLTPLAHLDAGLHSYSGRAPSSDQTNEADGYHMDRRHPAHSIQEKNKDLRERM